MWLSVKGSGILTDDGDKKETLILQNKNIGFFRIIISKDMCPERWDTGT